MTIIKENVYKGTRILIGNKKSSLISAFSNMVIAEGFEKIEFPVIQHEEIFSGKIGSENQHMMYRFTDLGGRKLCLAPEYTSVLIHMEKTFKHQKNVKLFYVQQCFRGEKPQAGRYREFTQFGVEIINPTIDYYDIIIKLAVSLVKTISVLPVADGDFKINREAIRGLDYYKEGRGFEISFDKLGAQKQVCGGGEYSNGIGFAIGIDRLMLLS